MKNHLRSVLLLSILLFALAVPCFAGGRYDMPSHNCAATPVGRLRCRDHYCYTSANSPLVSIGSENSEYF